MNETAGQIPNMSLSREHLNTPALRELVISAAHIAAPIFVAQGWTWGGYGTPKRIPTEGQIALRLRELCQTAFTEAAAGTTSSGRFTVQADDEGVSISLDLGSTDAPTDAIPPPSREAGSDGF